MPSFPRFVPMTRGASSGQPRRTRPGAPYLGVLVTLVAAATLWGLLVSDAYRPLPPLLRQTWRAQDLVTLLILPLLVLARRRALAGSLLAHVAWLGLLFWLAYGYAHLAFAVPFTRVFLLYVAVLGLAGFALLDGLVRVDAYAVHAALVDAPRRVAGWFLVVSSVGIAALWLSDIVVGMLGGTPANLHLAGLPNPTWVLDLACVVPLALASGVLLLGGRAAGPLLAGVVLVGLTVLSVAMLVTTPFALAAGLGDDPVAGPQLVVFTVVFGVLGAIEGCLLWLAWRRAHPAPAPWLAAAWWPKPGENRLP